MQFNESDLVFDFIDTYWVVKKYDTHRYYKTLSGAGLKGVDFIGILESKQLVFIEVKNFRAKHPTREEPYLVLSETAVFIDSIGDKLEDTFKVLNAIISYLHKRWWYRFFLKWEKYIPVILFRNRDWLFWHQVNRLAKQKKNITFLLWLEIDGRISKKEQQDLSKHIHGALKCQLENFVEEVVIANIKNPTYQNYLKVTQQYA